MRIFPQKPFSCSALSVFRCVYTNVLYVGPVDMGVEDAQGMREGALVRVEFFELVGDSASAGSFGGLDGGGEADIVKGVEEGVERTLETVKFSFASSTAQRSHGATSTSAGSTRKAPEN